MSPSLLWLDAPAAHPTVERHVFTDCGLAAVLSGAVIDVLSHLCTPDEIVMRQTVFAHLGDPTAAPRFAALSDALDRLASAHHAHVNAATAAERLFLRTVLLRRYAEVYPLILSLARDGLLTDSHAAFWSAREDEFASLTTALPEITANLTVLSAVTLTWSEKDGAALQAASVTDRAIAVRAAACAAELGIELPAEKSAPLRLDIPFSDAILALHADTAASLEAALAAFDTLPILDLLICLDELNFCAAIRALLDRAAARGFALTMPTVADSPAFDADALCDLTLLATDGQIVLNDARFSPEKRFFFLTGANGGGKTTYLRTVVGNLLLFLCGCPIVAARASIYPWRAVATHFPADERFSGTGRFVNEQNRAAALCAEADRVGGRDCFFCFNETFSGTDRQKGLTHTAALAQTMADAGVTGLFVTHFHEVSEIGLPMLCTVIDHSDENRRTYRIVEQAGIGTSYAHDVLRKYRLDAASLAARLAEKEGSQ
ncbi:MAG: hypothetical protein IJC15_02385 [Clostridia bacterium]|nr:hypothetical protein [Clostridia bacterium]